MNEQTEFRILVIDDNPAIHMDFQKILKMKQEKEVNEQINKLGDMVFGEVIDKSAKIADFNTIDLPIFQLDFASQGEEGVQCIKDSQANGKVYALIFVDIRMPPGIDGIETIKRIWKINSEIEIVICTAYSDYSWEETINELGVRDNLLILKKPFDSLAVRQLAYSLTKKWRLMQESRNREQNLEETVNQRTNSLNESLSLLEHQTSHDILTNLPNRLLLINRITQAIAQCAKSNEVFGVFFIDLDRFKLINDSLSHNAGDELLKQVSERLTKVTRKNDTIARLSGDEFVFVYVPSEANELCDFARLSERILRSVNEIVRIAERDVGISASVGVSVYPQDGTTPDELLRNADLAMYRAKALGGNQFQIYTSALKVESESRLEQEYELRNALINNEFFLEYQPQYGDKTEGMHLIGVEALIRWKHPKKGVMLPMDFVPLAEDTGLIVPIGEWVINTVCQQNKIWQDKGLLHVPTAVNVTTKQFMQPNFIAMIKQALERAQCEHQYLVIEVTENTVLSASNVIDSITELKNIGVQIVLDDFGSGNSGFNYLHKLPIDQLKIDKSFVQNIDTNSFDSVIVKAILDLASGLNMEVVAEGIESKSQLKFLESHDCHRFQGYYLHEPVRAEKLEELLMAQKK